MCSNICFKYRIYPTQGQAKTLQSQLDFCRFLYNNALEHRRLAFKAGKSKEATVFTQCKQIAGMTSSSEFPEAAGIRFSNLQAVLRRLDCSFQNFFRRVRKGEKPGFPRFCPKHANSESMLFPVSNFGIGKGDTGGIKLLPVSLKSTSKKSRQLQIYGVSGTVLVKLHREIEGKPKNVSLKRQGSKWFVVVCCEDVPKPAQAVTSKQIGIDLGVNVFAVDSDGANYPSPKPWKTAKEKIAHLSRQLARKQKGSNNRKKAKSALSKAHEHVANVREDHQHKLSAKLVKENSLIVVEDLSIQRMLSTKGEGKHQQALHSNISDSAWFAFRQKLEYKAARAGIQVVAVNPRDTSRTCSSCMQVKKKLALSERTFYCSACGSTMDRDANAARNILRLGLSLVGAPSAPCVKAKKAASLPSKLKRKAEEH